MSKGVAEAEVLERGTLSRARLWHQTIQQARRTVESDPAARRRLEVRAAALNRIRRPVFILGCPRSGTTYLGSLLESLPEVTYFFEPPLLKYYARLVYEQRISKFEAETVYRQALRTLLAAAPGTGTRIVEKNPNHVFVAKFLAATFTDAKFVTITRDGRDVALSLGEKPWHRADSVGSGRREPGGYSYGPYPHFYIDEDRRSEFETTSDLHRCIWIWRRHQEELEKVASVIATSRIHHLRYEDLMLSSESTIEPLMDFLEVPAASREYVRQRAAGGHTNSVGRWAGSLGEIELETIDVEAGPLMRKLAYI